MAKGDFLMFGKWFDSAYTGSMAGSGADVFAVWTYAIAKSDMAGYVELNPLVVASLIGMPVENVERAIRFLEQPDPKSRNPEHEGRRLLYQTGYLYLMVSKPIYRKKLDADERREYLRVKQRESRTRKTKNSQPVSMVVNNSQHLSAPSTHTDTDTDTDKKQRSSSKVKPSKAEDPRFADFQSSFRKYYRQQVGGTEAPWDAQEGSALKKFLKANPTISHDQWRRLLYNRTLSPSLPHAVRLSSWINRIGLAWLSGPADEWGKSIGGTNGRSTAQSKQQSSLAAARQVLSSLSPVDTGGVNDNRRLTGGGDHPGKILIDGK